jgi:hypothetical protein
LRDNGFIFKIKIHINENWINENYYRKELLYDENKNDIKFTNSIYELGNFPFLARHLVKEVEDNLKRS